MVIEACANAGRVHDLPIGRGHPVKVANTAAAAWKFQHLKRKTDRDDALRLAELEAIVQLPTVSLPDPATRQRRVLIGFRQELVGRRVARQNRIRALVAGKGLTTPRGAAAWTATGLAGIEVQARLLSSALSLPHGAEPGRYVLAAQPLPDCFQPKPVADLPVDLRERHPAAVRPRGKKPAAGGRAGAASTAAGTPPTPGTSTPA